VEIPAEVTALTEKLFSDAPEKELVAKNLLSRKFSVVSGGPGTGKTYTIARIMALILTANKNDLLVLAAPTGKAASRMGQSIAEAIEGLSSLVSSEIISIIQSVKQTSIHSLIGWDWYGGNPRFNREKPLPYDTVIVDEASMMDADIAYALFSALKKDARLILVGDKDQLASVEAGSVMASICASLKNGTTNQAKDAISELTVGHRFSQKSGIGRLSRAINNQENFSEIEKIFNAPEHTDELRWIVPVNGQNALSQATQTILDELTPYFDSQTAEEAIENARNCLLLSPLRRTPFGVNALNYLIEKSAKERGLIDTSQKFYHLRPVLITQNDYTLSLYNGDFGVMVQNQKDNKTEVWFQTTEGISAFSPYYLPPHETVYAMTVHKSQGSEFNHVILILPDHDIPLLTIELIYTAITRAKKKFTLISSAEVFKQAVSRRIVRSSGLEERLWK
ncbi:exodeoxyribonuclease V subunit alpha, partial [bacterium]|nr:exodeoxyribonuclease V subunit alpha [bacterium]